ncbi:predicted protein [Arabidopsis lyrata subsp. lyrata]|uniref:Predicted protein n=1 Tax=Arabidopsis lyrata subsp. lyrata TaxID=81972 RepID=D7KJD8_ARALL|nr:predicted protein [Arabidopsis lyrata subsp. lyrata]
MDRRVNSWSRTADEPGMGVSEPRGPPFTQEVLVITRMTGPNDLSSGWTTFPVFSTRV